MENSRREPPRSGLSRRSNDRVGGTVGVSTASIEEMVERKVEEILAAKALNDTIKPPVADISDEVQKRLDMLEQKV